MSAATTTPLGQVFVTVVPDGTVMVRCSGVRIIVTAQQARAFGEVLWEVAQQAQMLLDDVPETRDQP